MKIGSKLKELRVAHGYTQEELAAILNVSRSTISSWEINRTYPDLSILVSLSELYDITVDQLISEDDKLVDTMTNQTKTNTIFKRIILSLVVVIISFAAVVVFLLKDNRKPEEQKITHYDFSEYAKIIKKGKEDSAYYYKDSFVGEIIDTLSNGTETKVIQNEELNTKHNKQITLKIDRDKKERISKVTVLDDKNTIQLLQSKYKGDYYVEKYDSVDKLKAVTADFNSGRKKESNDLLVFVRNDGPQVSAFFKKEEKNN